MLNPDKFLSARILRERGIKITDDRAASLQAKLPQGTYWIESPDRTILWHWDLLSDWLCGGDGRPHQELLDEYLSTTTEESL